MRRALIAAMLAGLFGSNPVFAQVGGMLTPTPSIGATSPLGITPSSPVGPIGIPLGSTELVSPGISPGPADTMGIAGNGTTCPITGSPSSSVTGASTNFDGGGLGMGTGTSLPGTATTSTTCSTSSSTASSSTATMSSSSGTVARTGIPFGSVEIGNAGVSATPIVPTPILPTPSLTPFTTGSGMSCSLTGSSMSSTGC